MSRFSNEKTTWALIAGLSLLGLLPLLLVQAQAIWDRDHMWFAFAVLPITFFYSVWISGRSPQLTKHPLRWSVSVATLAFSAVISASSIWNFSPWLAQVAATTVFFAWALSRWGAKPRPTAGAIALMLLTALPWPINLDVAFDGWLKDLAGGFASDTLDAFLVPNIFQYGQLRTEFLIFEIRDLSSWGSVFALIAIAALVGILRHRSLAHTLLLVLCTPIIYVIVAYVGLLVCVMTSTESAASPLVNRIGAFQFGLLLVQVVNLLLVDQFMAFLFRTVPVTEPDFGFIFVFTNKLLHWPQEDPQESIVPEDPLEREAFEQARHLAEEKRRIWPEIGFFDWPTIKWTAFVSTFVLVACSALPYWLLASGNLLPDPTPFREVTEAELANFPGQDALPSQVGEWQQLDFRTKTAPSAELRWTYGWEGQSIQVTLSFPHEVTPLTGWVDDDRLEKGWSHLNTQFVEDQSGKPTIVRSQYANPLGGNILVLRSGWDSQLEQADFGKLERRESRRRRRSPLLELLNPEQQEARKQVSYWLVAECEIGGQLEVEALQEFQSSFEAMRAELADELTAGQLEQFVD